MNQADSLSKFDPGLMMNQPLVYSEWVPIILGPSHSINSQGFKDV